MFTKTQKATIRAAVVRAVNALPDAPSCGECLYVNNIGLRKFCKKANGQEIPAEVIPVGCPLFEADDIPF